jgi:hypothetical protein
MADLVLGSTAVALSNPERHQPTGAIRPHDISQFDCHARVARAFGLRSGQKCDQLRSASPFWGQVRELSSGVFSFARQGVPAQLIIRVEEYKYMKLSSEGEETHITLIDPRTEEYCLVSDAATKPETLFKGFAEVGSTIQ